MSFQSDIEAYKGEIDNLVGTKTDPNSIDPVDVVTIGKSLADLLVPYVDSINNFDILGNTLPPDNGDGVDNDVYFQGGTSIKVYKKTLGVWVQKTEITLGIDLVDGNISLRARIDGITVTVSPGNWIIDNVIYAIATQTQFPIDAADLNWDRIDAITADDNGSVNYIPGVASSTPAEPTVPADSILVDYVYVPSSSSGNPAYIADSNVPIVLATSEFTYFTNSTYPGIASDLSTGIITIADMVTNFPTISSNGIIRGDFDMLYSGAWYSLVGMSPTVTKDGSGNLLTATWDLGNTDITTIRGRIY